MARGRSVLTALVATWVIVALPAAQGQTPPLTPSQASSPPPPKFDLEKSVEAARQVVRNFTERMKGELAAAIKADGAANAISLCQTISPDISTNLSDESGFEVTRTSLKLRNPENAPGPWELKALNSFQEQATAGIDPAKLEQYEVVTTPEGDRLFHYVKGIPMTEMCLACHGSDIKNDVRAELTRYYPDDKATGYRLGELRGAFSLVKLIEE